MKGDAGDDELTTVRTGVLHCGAGKKCSSCLSLLHTSFREHLIYYEQPLQMALHVAHSYCEE